MSAPTSALGRGPRRTKGWVHPLPAKWAALLLIAASQAQPGGAWAQAGPPFSRDHPPTAAWTAQCRRDVTPEDLVYLQQFSRHSVGGLFNFATCRELVERSDLYCSAFPGGPGSKAKVRAGDRSYTYVGGDGKIHYDYEFGVCTSRAAGYLFLASLVAGAPRSQLLPYAKRILHGVKRVTPAQLIDASIRIFRTKRLEGKAIPRAIRRAVKAGLFNYLVGRDACRKIPVAHIRQECLSKAAAIAALQAGDEELCLPGDLMCAALFEGKAACVKAGEEAVNTYCDLPPSQRELPDFELLTPEPQF